MARSHVIPVAVRSHTDGFISGIVLHHGGIGKNLIGFYRPIMTMHQQSSILVVEIVGALYSEFPNLRAGNGNIGAALTGELAFYMVAGIDRLVEPQLMIQSAGG